MGEDESAHLPSLEGLNGKGWSGDKQIDDMSYNFNHIDFDCGNVEFTHDNDHLQTSEIEPLSKGKEPKRETPQVKVESSSKVNIKHQIQEKKLIGAIIEASNYQMGESWTKPHFPSLDLAVSIKEMARERMISTGNESIAGIFSWRALRAIGIVAEEFVKDQMASSDLCLSWNNDEHRENVQHGSLSSYEKIMEEKEKASKECIPTSQENGNEEVLQPKNVKRKRENFS